MDPRDNSVSARIEAVRRTIEDRLADEPTLDDLAAAADLSPFHFHRLFRGLVGETVAGYRRRLRLERSAYRIEHGERDLLTVALDAGYASHESFGRTYAALLAPIVTKGIGGVRYALGDPPSREVYLNDPRKMSPPALRTEIWMPIVRE